MAIRLKLVTPTAQLLDEEVVEVRAPGATGGFGVRSSHTAYLTTLDAGPLIFTKENGESGRYAVIDGFVEVGDDEVVVLAEDAIEVGEIDPEEEDRIIKAALDRMAGYDPSSDTYRKEEANIRRATARAFTARV